MYFGKLAAPTKLLGTLAISVALSLPLSGAMATETLVFAQGA